MNCLEVATERIDIIHRIMVREHTEHILNDYMCPRCCYVEIVYKDDRLTDFIKLIVNEHNNKVGV